MTLVRTDGEAFDPQRRAAAARHRPRGLAPQGRERRLQRAGAPRRAPLARGGAAQDHRALSAADGDSLFDRLFLGDASALSGGRDAALAISSPRASSRDVKQRERSEGRIAKEIEAALEAVTSLDDDTILRAFRAGDRGDRSAPTSMRRPMAKSRPAITLKIKPDELPFVPSAAAVPRDLRPFARGGGRASPLRAGGARRPALVGPAAGFPHRGARAW